MFGKKKELGIPVMHYEGIEGFSIDYPCRIEIKSNVFEIKRLKPETTVSLALNRIKSFTAMDEKNFMQKYKGIDTITSKSGIGKYYLIVEYDKGKLVFWGTAKEYGKFLDLQKGSIEAPSHIEL